MRKYEAQRTRTRRQLRATVLGTSAMLAQTAPLTINAATCGPARALATTCTVPMPSATSMPLIAYAGKSRQALSGVGSRLMGRSARPITVWLALVAHITAPSDQGTNSFWP